MTDYRGRVIWPKLIFKLKCHI
uniref:Uncharacterized protein n=1 Tax=Anguilla anguilla TaxID=7936 RepID=A0A0E9SYY6_ANGAN